MDRVHRRKGKLVTSGALEQVGGKGVPQRVGRHTAPYAGRLGKVAHDVEHHHPREMPPTAVQKQIALLAGLGVGSPVEPLVKVKARLLHGIGRHRHHALLRPPMGVSSEQADTSHLAAFLTDLHDMGIATRSQARMMFLKIVSCFSGTLGYGKII